MAYVFNPLARQSLQATPVPQVYSVASASTINIDAGLYDTVDVTALATGAAFAAPTGVINNAQKLVVRLKDNGVSRALSWDPVFASGGPALPTATTSGKRTHLGFIYNSGTSEWFLVASATQP